MTEIQRADPETRRRAVTVVLWGALIGAGLILGYGQYRPELEAWLGDTLADSERSALFLAVMVVVGCVPVLGFAGYLWLLGRRIIRAQRFPPPGTRVPRDTPVLQDRVAIRRGRVIQGLAVALAVSAIGMAFALWRFWDLVHAGR